MPRTPEPYDPYAYRDWTGGKMDEFGFTEQIPGHNWAIQRQLEADKITRQRQEQFMQGSTNALREGLGNLQTYRPGGAASLLSPYYQNISQSLAARARMQYSPDLLELWRWNQAHRARKAAKRNNVFSQVLGVAQAATSSVGAIAGMGDPKKATTPDAAGPMQGPAGGAAGKEMNVPHYPMPQGSFAAYAAAAPTASPAQQGPSPAPAQVPTGGGGAQPQGPAGSAPAGGAGAGGGPQPMAAMGGTGMPPTEHPFGANAGMAANFGPDMGMVPDDAIALVAETADVNGNYSFMDFAEQQTDQMLMVVHQMFVDDQSLGGYLG